MASWNPLILHLVRTPFSQENLLSVTTYINNTTDSGSTPLHYAALRKDIRFVRFLLQQGLDVNTSNHYQETALHWAVKAGHTQVVEELLASGARQTRDSENHSPLDWAVEEEQVHLIALLRPSKSLPLPHSL
jgi:uncharacterized protein